MFNSIYFVYSLSDKTKRMAYYGNKGLAEVAVNSNILRNTDNRLYVGTDSVLRAYNTDGTYTTMANMVNYHPIFIATPIVINPEVLLAKVTINQQQTGKKVYELKDHLGNVRATITDRKFLTGIDIPAYQAEPVTATDYYAFGSPQFGRKYTSDGGSYRFGFNGKELDNEIKGDGNSLDFGSRIYDSRLGRWLSLDPLQAKYPSLSPYNFCANSPIMFVDHDGKDFGFVIDHETKTVTVVATVYTVKENKTAVEASANMWNSQSGKFSYVDEGSGKEYKINFAVNVVVEKTKVRAQDKVNTDRIGNSMVTYDDNSDEFNRTKSDGTKEKIRGGVERGNDGIVQEQYEHTLTMPHELGHFFGILDWTKGVMNQGDSKTEEVTKGILQNIFSKAGVDTGYFSSGDTPSEAGRESNREQKAAGSRQAKSTTVIIGCDENFSGKGEIKEN